MAEIKQLAQANPRLVITADEWLREIPPPNYTAKPLFQRGQITSLVAHPNHGKSTFSTMCAVAHVGGLTIGGVRFQQGNVLLLAGDNAYNASLQVKAAALRYGVSLETLGKHMRVYRVDGEIEACYAKIRAQRDAEKWEPFVSITIDTFSAYFGREDENSNTQTHEAISIMQRFTLPEWGSPTVIVNCHPSKEAKRDNMKPRGGGAIFGRVDCNMSLWNDGGMIEVHYNKIRGIPWEPVTAELSTQQVGFSDGSTTEVSVAEIVGMEQAHQIRMLASNEDAALLEVIRARPDQSMSEWARAMGWLTPNGAPYHAKVTRAVKRMEKDGKLKRDSSGAYTVKRG